MAKMVHVFCVNKSLINSMFLIIVMIKSQQLQFRHHQLVIRAIHLLAASTPDVNLKTETQSASASPNTMVIRTKDADPNV